jgi:hypothetical protein
MISLLILIAGFIIGLGAVTVIDIHGFLARKSPYWTEATIRTHKVTKPLIWVGMFLVIIGSYLMFTSGTLTTEVYERILIVQAIMILNGYFLSYVVSPRLIQNETEGRSRELLDSKLQAKISISFIISFLSWWGLLVYIISRIY